MKLKNNPLTLAANVARRFDQRLNNNMRLEPKFVNAVKTIKPAVFTGFGAIPDLTGSFVSDDFYSKTLARSNKSRNTPISMFKLPKVEYPEDEIRRAFFFYHPSELNRPFDVSPNSTTVPGSGFDFARDFKKGNVSSESVVQYTLFLMKHHKLSRHKAYHKALTAFYRVREEEQSNSMEFRKNLPYLKVVNNYDSAEIKLSNPVSSYHVTEQEAANKTVVKR